MKGSLIIKAAELCMVLMFSACFASSDVESSSIDLHPESGEAARAAIEQIERLSEFDPVAAMEAARRLRPRLDELNGLVARLEVQPGNFVDFYEPQPGNLVIAERGPIGGVRVLNQDQVLESSAVELYRRLSGGAAPPMALQEAEARTAQNALALVERTRDGVRPGAGSLTVGESDNFVTQEQSGFSSDGELWRNTACFNFGDRRDCLPNRTGDGALNNHTKTSFLHVAPYRGNIGVQFSYDGALRNTWFLLQGEYWSFAGRSATYWTCPWYAACGTQDYYLRDHRWSIFDAGGDGYHLAAAFSWNCTWLGCG